MGEGNRRVGLEFGILLLFGFFASAQLCAASDPVRDSFFFFFRTILCTSDACVVVCSDAIRRVAMRVRIVLCVRERERERKNLY